jgi:hypothetical protein
MATTNSIPMIGQQSAREKVVRRAARLVTTAALSVALLAGAAIGYGQLATASVSATATAIAGETPCTLGGTAPCGSYGLAFPSDIPGETPCPLGGTAPCGLPTR